ncbi:MAG: hypothetical protein EA402_00430, partial [Planctomycetota bacterium]
DDNRDLVGRATQLELIVRAANSGDEERLTLVPLDEIGGAFQGTLPTTLGSARSGDNVLQVYGRDTIVYGLSPEFIERTNYQGDPETASGSLQIRTDGELYASSGDIVDREEQARLREEEEIRRALHLGSRQDAVEEDQALAQRRRGDQVRPGSPINIRVVDPDASTSPELNTVYVQVQATSGDVIRRLPLQETEEFSGVFEGSVPTDLLPAVAIASDSAEGVDPNQALIDGGSGWVGRSLGTEARRFAVDLNQLRSWGAMRVEHGAAERTAKSLVVQTSLDGVNYTTVGIGGAEDPAAAWDGSPSLEMVAQPQGMPGSYAELRNIFDYEFLDREGGKAQRAVADGGMVLNYENDVRAAQRSLPFNDRTQVMIRLRGAFWVDERVMARFKSEANEDDEQRIAMRTFVNGQRGRELEDGSIAMELGRGVHVIEVFAVLPDRQHRRGALSVAASLDPQAPLSPMAAEMFDRQGFDMLFDAAIARPQAKLKRDGDAWDIDFQGIEARAARLVLRQYEGDAPAIRRLSLRDSDGEAILPLSQDARGGERMVLNVVPQDQISITYRDEYPYSDDLPVSEVRLAATFHDGSISAAFPQFAEGQGSMGESLIPVRRFEPGDTVRVFVRDNDLSVSSERDSATFKVRTSLGEELTLQARETAPFSGLFQATVFPVAGEPQRDNEITVAPGDDLTLIYRDEENTNPGVTWDRRTVVEQVVWREPQIRAYQTRLEEIPEDVVVSEQAGNEATGIRQETILPRYDLVIERPLEPNSEGSAVFGSAAIFEIQWPTVAKHAASSIDVYVQTERQRQALEASGEGFDFDLPGTRTITVRPGRAQSGNAGGLYRQTRVETPGLFERNELDDGRFSVNVPLVLGEPPLRPVDETTTSAGGVEPLPVAAGDVVHIGFRYEDENGQQQVLTARAALSGVNAFEVMDQHFNKTVEQAHVGERVYMRVIDPSRAKSSERDRLSVTVRGKSGRDTSIELVEEVPHSGVFKGFIWLVHEEDEQSLSDRINSVPVVFGDELTLLYDDGGQQHQQSLAVFTGDDGRVVPFTKRFADDDMAVRTMFTLAEAHFEQAKLFRDAA